MEAGLEGVYYSVKLNFRWKGVPHGRASALMGVLFFQLGFTTCKAEQPLRGMELQEKEAQKDYSTQ